MVNPDDFPPSLRRVLFPPDRPLAIEISEQDAASIGAILASNSRIGLDSFSHMLVQLICKADAEQREVLRRVYPTHVAAYEAWAGS